MPSLLESVTGVLGAGDTYEKLGEIIGGDTEQTTEAAELAVPTILGGLAERVTDDGPGPVLEMLDRTEGLVLDDLDGFLDRGDPGLGADLLDDIFGSQRDDLIGRLASKAEMGGSMVTRLLSMLAPMVIDTVRRKRHDESLDGDGVSALLAEEREALDRSGLLYPMGDALTGGITRRAEVVGGGVGTALESRTGERVSSSADRVIEAAEGEVTGTGPAVGLAPAVGDGDVRGGFGWLGWAIGSVVLVLALAWLLSRCDDQPETPEATRTVVGVDGVPGGSALDAESAGPAEAVAAPEVDADQEPALGDAVVDDTATDADSSSDTDFSSDTDADSDAEPDPVVDGEAVDDDGDDEAGPAAGETINELLDLDPVTFDIRSARITIEGRAVLDEAARFMEDNPDIRVEIGGHTDSDGSEANNLVLSRTRAEAVKNYLERFGIDGDRLETKGYGETEPLVPNDSSGAKAENRRIAFTILPDR